MEQLLNNPFYEYLLLLSPSTQVKGEVMKIKNLYKNEYGIISAPNSKPHITLVDFCQFKSTEQTILIYTILSFISTNSALPKCSLSKGLIFFDKISFKKEINRYQID